MDGASAQTTSLMEAARRAGWSRATAYRLAAEGKFPGAFRMPGHRGYRVWVRIFEADLEASAQRLSDQEPAGV